MADITQLVKPSESKASTANKSTEDDKTVSASGNVLYPNNNLVFSALNMIDNELFYREEPQIEPIVRGGLVTQSLAYLVGDLWDFYETETRTKTERDT